MRAAVIGLGPMGRRHLASVARVPALALVAAADLRVEALDSAGLAPEVARFENPAELLETTRPELVVLATTAPSHRSLVERAVATGARAILCEKPLACSLADARAMLECCRTHGVALAVNHVRRHVPAYRWLAEQIASGAWGEVRSLRASVPGVGLGCLGTHFVDLMLFLAGQPLVTVAGWVDEPRGRNPRGPEFVDPGGVVLGETANGVRLFLHQIEDGAGPHHVAIDLTGARVLVDERTRAVEVLVRGHASASGPGRPAPFEQRELPVDYPFDLDIVSLTAAVLEQLVNGQPLTCEGVNGYRSLEAIVAAYLSHERGHLPVTIPIQEPAGLERVLSIT